MFFNLIGTNKNFLDTDLHSHLIPDVDDGVKNWEEALIILKGLSQLGYTKVVTTPHVIFDYYPNTPAQIRTGVTKLNELAAASKIEIEVEAGAEYYVDEHFIKKIKAGDELLTFGDDYILIETAFINRPVFLEEVIFGLQSRGLKPILAHPERYSYLQDQFSQLKTLEEMGVLFQININSFSGFYSKEAKKLAQKMIENNLAHFLGSDVHNQKHLNQIRQSIKSKLFQKCRQLDLLNSSL